MKKPVLIFDFDGTIADTFTPTMQILGADYRKWGDKFNKRHTVNELRSLPIKEIVKTIPGGWWKFVYLLLKAKLKIKQTASQIEAYPGIVYTLRTLHDQGFAMVIVTSNQVDPVQEFLRRYNLDQLFAGIYPTNGLWRKAKTIKRVLHQYHLTPQDAYYIGDEIRDIQACKQVGLPIISVSYGFNSLEGLKRFQPNHLVKKPTQLLTFFADTSPQE